MVIVSIIGCGFGILLHGRLRKGRGIGRQLLLAHARRALLGRHAGRLGIALLLGRQDIALALKVRIPLVVEQGVHGVAFDGLALKQHLRHQIELIATGVQDLDRTTMGLTHNALNLDIDAARRLLGVILVIGVIATKEHLMLRLAKHLRAQLLAHAQARDHLARHLGCALQIVARARRNVIAHELLGNATAQEHGELVEHLVLGLEEVVLLRKLQRVAQSLTAADDRDLVDRIGVLQDVVHQGVTALVVGNRGALGLGHHATLALRSGNHALHRLLDLVHRDHGTMTASGQQRRLVEQVRQIGTRKANGHLGELLKLNVLVHRLILGMHAQDLLAALYVRTIDRDLAVKATGAQQCRVQNIGAIGRGDQDDRLAFLETVHLDQQLVERLLALVVTAAQASSALTSHSIDLIDEDD